MDAWGRNHPQLARLIMFGSFWLLLRWWPIIGRFADLLFALYVLILLGLNWATWIGWIRYRIDRVSNAIRSAHEYKIEGETALAAVAADTVEGDIQVAGQRDAFTTQIARLEAIGNRNLQQELLLRQCRRNVRDLDRAEARRHATPETLGTERLAAFGPIGAPSLLGRFRSLGGGLLSGWRVWALAGAVTLSGWGAAAVQAALKERVEDQRDAARRDMAQAMEERDGWKQAWEDTNRAVIAAQAQAAESSRVVEEERRRRSAAAARERRRQRAIQDVLSGSGEPPDWGLRDNGSLSERPAATDGGAAGDPA